MKTEYVMKTALTTWHFKHNIKLKQVLVSANVGEGGSTVQLIVGMEGYDYKWYRRNGGYGVGSTGRGSSTLDKNVHLSMNGPLSLSFEDMQQLLDDLHTVVRRSRLILKGEAR